VKFRVPIPTAIRNLRKYYAPQEGRGGKLRLDFNEHTVGCSAAVLRAIRKLDGEQIAMYPEYESVTSRLARSFGVRANEIQLNNGADGAIRQIIDTFVEPGNTVLTVEPTFPMYRFFGEIGGARIESLRYDAGMTFPLAGVLRALRKSPRVFFLANPNNPTGTLLDRAAIVRMIGAAPRTLFVVDEAYYEFSGVTIAPWIRRYANLAIVRTFSKAAALAALRLGVILANPEIIGWLARTREPFEVNVAALVAAEAVAKDQRSVKAYTAEVRENRRMLASALDSLGVRSVPSAANFVLADLGDQGPAIVKAMRRKGILLRSFAASFGSCGYVRITVGTRAQTQRVIRELKALL
jgi:histidinol-phosphate aminotransferase